MDKKDIVVKACFIVGMAVIVFLAACTSTVQVQQPIGLYPEVTAPITFTRLIIRVPSGTRIGSHHDGLLKIAKFRHIWQHNIVVASDEFKIVASEHLQSRGYNVKGGDNLLFGTDDSAKAEYQLGGTIIYIKYDTYAPLAGNSSKSSITIEWQLYDAFSEKVVYKTTTIGYGKQKGIGSWCIQEAFRSALDSLLSDAEFVAIIKESPYDSWEKEKNALTQIYINTCKSQQSLRLPENLDSVQKSVLVIRAGASTGSGVIISQDGYALTAAHLVSGLEKVVVKFLSGLELSASVVRVDSHQDVALIKIPGRGHSCLTVIKEPLTQVGFDVFAIGAPTGEELAFSVTKGIISGFRKFQGTHYLQTDAALNPGNSGGPLLSVDGNVIGIVSWKIAAPGFEGLAFCVPIHALVGRLAISLK